MKRKRNYLRICFHPTILWLFFSAIPVSAHPHMFIDVMAKFMFADSMLSGMNIFRDIDEMTSASLIEELDVNRNGTFEMSEYCLSVLQP